MPTSEVFDAELYSYCEGKTLLSKLLPNSVNSQQRKIIEILYSLPITRYTSTIGCLEKGFEHKIASPLRKRKPKREQVCTKHLATNRACERGWKACSITSAMVKKHLDYNCKMFQFFLFVRKKLKSDRLRPMHLGN